MQCEFHTPVLVDEVLKYLQPQPNGIYIDGTIGGGGHAEMILKHLLPNGKLIGFDIDKDALEYTSLRLKKFGNRVILIHDNFVNVLTRISEHNIQQVDGVILDLGVSSYQLDSADRGFSFQKDSKLDMRMNKEQSLSGFTVINTYDQKQLSQIFHEFGEEKFARKIAYQIVKQRPIQSTYELVNVIKLVVGHRHLVKSLARIFQAIRIEVNKELDNLKKALHILVPLLKKGGRIVVISYHSLEDRIVKHCFKEMARTSQALKVRYLEPQRCQPLLRILTPRPVTPTIEEISKNPRARSAKLRAGERV